MLAVLKGTEFAIFSSKLGFDVSGTDTATCSGGAMLITDVDLSVIGKGETIPTFKSVSDS